MSGLPTDTQGGVGGGDYFKLAQGQNKIMIVGDAITGYEYWTNEDKPVRSKEKFTELKDVKIRQVKNQKTGETEEKAEKADTQKFFWAMPVYDFKDESFKLWQVTQKSIKESLLSLQQNDDWGNPIGKYTISIDRKGEGLTTEYSIMANPVKDQKKLDEVMKMYQEQPIDVEAMMFGDS